MSLRTRALLQQVRSHDRGSEGLLTTLLFPQTSFFGENLGEFTTTPGAVVGIFSDFPLKDFPTSITFYRRSPNEPPDC
jgi:hypothetical protein